MQTVANIFRYIGNLWHKNNKIIEKQRSYLKLLIKWGLDLIVQDKGQNNWTQAPYLSKKSLEGLEMLYIIVEEIISIMWTKFLTVGKISHT